MKFLLLCVVGLCARVSIAQEYSTHATTVAIVQAANQQRVQYRLHTLQVDETMCRFAQRHANWMVINGRFQHSGGPYPEIIAMGQTSPRMVMQDWINSPGHRAILLGNGRMCGWGYRNANGRRYWVGVIR